MLVIWYFNKQVLRGDPDTIMPGLKLKIPVLDHNKVKQQCNRECCGPEGNGTSWCFW